VFLIQQSFYIYSAGQLKRHDNTLQFITEDGNKRDIPIERVNDIYVMSEMTLNTKLINFLSRYGILMHFFNYYSFYSATLYPRETRVSGDLLVRQVEHFIDQDKRLYLAKQFVTAAADNIYRNLRYYSGRGKDLKLYMHDIDDLRKNIDKQKDVEQLMGLEGNIHKRYYDAWQIIINQKIEFEKRVKRPPDNMINTLISYINSLIYTSVLSQIYYTQLNPTISYLHVPGNRRFSLSLDIAEIFKPLIGDRLIFSLLNRNQIQAKHFTRELNFLHLTKEGSQIILNEYDARLKQTIKHKDLNKVVSYNYLMRLEGYKLIKHLIGEKEYQSFRIWW
jgi:CRISPR-associated protein Cas1